MRPAPVTIARMSFCFVMIAFNRTEASENAAAQGMCDRSTPSLGVIRTVNLSTFTGFSTLR